MRRRGGVACYGGGLNLAVQLELATQSLAAQKMQFNYVNSWADENSANRKARKKNLRGYNGCLKMQSFYNEKKGSSSSWKIFCVVCFPQKRNGVEVHHYKKKVSRLNRSWRVEALEKSAEATRRAFKQHHAILHPTEKCCIPPHSDFSHLFIPPFQSLLRTCCLLFCCFKCCFVCTNQLKIIFKDT